MSSLNNGIFSSFIRPNWTESPEVSLRKTSGSIKPSDRILGEARMPFYTGREPSRSVSSSIESLGDKEKK